VGKIQDSKLLSLILRHQPELVGIELDPAGWASVEALLAALRCKDPSWTVDRLRAIVAENDKRRFAFDADGRRIRASQGHSVEVELGYETATPPERLYHGTVARFLVSIREKGLLKGERHHVHLSASEETARRVGERRGAPVVLVVRAGEMHREGARFFCSANGVWLTDHVPPDRVSFPDVDRPHQT
jgi:putative RNA 2'-phosphotransferase